MFTSIGTKVEILMEKDAKSTYMKYLKHTNSLKQRLEWWLPGTRVVDRGLLLNGFQLCKGESSTDLSYQIVPIDNITVISHLKFC